MHSLVRCHPDDVMLNFKKARRHLKFFVNSSFMDVPDAPSIRDIFSWNVMTPYYLENVTYIKADLEQRTVVLGVSTLLYLLTLFRTDWNNFLERLSIHDEGKFGPKLNRGSACLGKYSCPKLSRSVSGVMYYKRIFQEGYFEEALKTRNALQEFTKREGPLPITILGIRKHIFTGSESSLANYIALQETSFVTLGQRVLTKPLHIRLY